MNDIENSGCVLAFGQFIRAGRLAKSLTQEEVAELLGWRQATINRIENGKRTVDLEKALRICKVLKLDLSDFIKTQI